MGLNSFWTDANHGLSRSKHCILVLSGWRTANCSVCLKSACSDSLWINNPHTASHANPCKWGLGAIQFLSVFVCRVHVCLYVETRGKNWVCLWMCAQEGFSNISFTVCIHTELMTLQLRLLTCIYQDWQYLYHDSGAVGCVSEMLGTRSSRGLEYRDFVKYSR